MNCRPVLLVLCLLATASLPSCRKRTDETEARPRLVQRNTPVGAARSAGAAPSRAESGYALQPFARIGVPECDAYLVKYRACIASRVPAGDRAPMLDSLRQTGQVWRRSAATDRGRSQLKAACELAAAAAAAAMQSYGCEW